MKGLAGSNDLREVHAKADAGDTDAAEALEVFCYRIRCTVGAYAAALGRLDAVVFTAGIGENDADVRARVCAGLGVFGVELDERAQHGPVPGDADDLGGRQRGGGAGGADERGAGDRRAGPRRGPRGRRKLSERGVGYVRLTQRRVRSDRSRRAQPCQKPRMWRSTASAASAGSPARTAS